METPSSDTASSSNMGATPCVDTYVALHDAETPPPAQRAAVALARRRGTWTPVRQSSIRALFRLASTTSESRPPTRQRARTLNDAVFLPRTRAEPQRGRRATTGELSTVFRWVTTFVGQPVDETVWCQICFENVAASEAFSLEPCGHQYCRPCFAEHLEHKINEGDAFPVCFHPVLRDEDGENDRLFGRRTCGAQITDAVIKELCGPEVWAMYEASREEQDEPNHVCPYCFHTQSRSSSERREAMCELCRRAFCTLHGSAHGASSCGDYEFATVKEHKLHHAATAKNAKPCPSCKASVEKTGNCNHMRCVVCTTSFCWLCGDLIDDGILPAHYDSAGDSPCRGKQWDTAPNTSLSDRMLASAWQCLTAVFCVPMALLLALGAKLLACCCRPLKPRFGKSFLDVFTDIREVCETWFRAVVTFAVFGVFRYAVLLGCMPPAFVLTYLGKMISCVCSKPYRRFFDREAMTVFKDLDLMFATVIFTFVCAVAVSVIVVVGVVVRLLHRCFSCCTPRLSTAETIPAVKEQDDDLEAARGSMLRVLAVESPTAATHYVRA